MSIDIYLKQLGKNKCIISIILITLPFVVFATEQLPEEIEISARNVIDYICKEDFKSAEETARKIVKKYPDNPAGYFFVAAVLDSWMSYYFDNRKEDEFYKYCELAVEKGERALIKNSYDEWALFFMGGAEGFKGTYEARNERWITAFRYGWRGVSMLMKLSDRESKIIDINYGIGYYEYWRSAMMKTLWWMPGVKDRREEGIKKIYKAFNEGIYTQIAASTALIEIFINENRLEETLLIVDKMLRKYPASSVFLWGKGRASYGLGRFDEAESIFRFLLNKYESDETENYYNPFLCHFWLARINFAKKEYKAALEQVAMMEKFKFNDDMKKRLEKYYSEANTIKKRVQEKPNKK